MELLPVVSQRCDVQHGKPVRRHLLPGSLFDSNCSWKLDHFNFFFLICKTVQLFGTEQLEMCHWFQIGGGLEKDRIVWVRKESVAKNFACTIKVWFLFILWASLFLLSFVLFEMNTRHFSEFTFLPCLRVETFSVIKVK